MQIAIVTIFPQMFDSFVISYMFELYYSFELRITLLDMNH